MLSYKVREIVNEELLRISDSRQDLNLSNFFDPIRARLMDDVGPTSRAQMDK